MRHYATLRTWPLQVYSSGIVFSPEASIVRRNNLSRVPDWLKRLSTVESNWPSLVQTLTDHEGPIVAMALSFDGRLIVSVDFTTIKIWDATTGEMKKTLVVKGPSFEGQRFESVVYSGDGRLILTTCGTHAVELRNADTGLVEKLLVGHSATILAVAISHDVRQIATGSVDRKVQLWDVSKGAVVETLVGHSHWIMTVAFSPDGQQIASGSGDSTIKLWGIMTGGVKTLIGHQSHVEAVVFSHDGTRIASGSADKTVRLWDSATTSCERVLMGHPHGISDVAFSSTGHLIASGSWDGIVNLWDTTTGELQDTLVGHSLAINNVAFLPYDQRLVSASMDGTIKVWDTSVKVPQSEVPRRYHGGGRNIAFPPNGGQVASGSNEDDTVIIYETETAEIDMVLIGHTDRVDAVAFSSDGRQIVSANFAEMRLWDVAKGETKATLSLAGRGRGPITSVAFLPSGRAVVSLMERGVVNVWDPLTGGVKRLANDPELDDWWRYDWTLSRDGRWLASRDSYDERSVIGVYDIEKSLSTSEPQDDTSDDSLSLTAYQELKPSAFANWFDSWDSPSLAIHCLTYMVGRAAVEQSSQEVDVSQFLYIHDQWINCGQTPVLRIPPDFEVACYDVNGDQVALEFYSNNNNNVLIFSIDRRALLSAAVSPSITEEPRTEA